MHYFLTLMAQKVVEVILITVSSWYIFLGFYWIHQMWGNEKGEVEKFCFISIRFPFISWICTNFCCGPVKMVNKSELNFLSSQKDWANIQLLLCDKYFVMLWYKQNTIAKKDLTGRGSFWLLVIFKLDSFNDT